MLLSPSRQINTRNGGLLGVAMNGGGLLGGGMPPAPRPIPPAPAPAPAMPQRERVSPWRIFDRVLGGQTITDGLDAERGRLEAEAQRPGLLARQAQLRSLAEQMGPAAMIAFETNPEKFGESLAEQYAPQVIAAGGIQSVIGNGQRVAAPSFDTFGDSMVRRDPLSGRVDTVASRGPTYGEETARLNANNPVNIAPGGRAVDPRTGAVIAEGAPRVFSAADATQLYTEDGAMLAENTRDAPAVDPVNAEKSAAANRAALDMVGNTRGAVARAREQASGWTTGLGSTLAAIPGTPAANLKATIDTIEANLSFAELAKMRANSPTGGALGGIALRELELLGATVASLRQSQSPEEFARSLKTIDDSLKRYEDVLRQAGQPAPSAGGVSREAAIAELRRRGRIP